MAPMGPPEGECRPAISVTRGVVQVKDLRDKIAVVTGAAQGIGRGIAEAPCAAGMKECS